MEWMPRQRPEEVDQSMLPCAIVASSCRNKPIICYAAVHCVKPVPTDLSQYSRHTSLVSQLGFWSTGEKLQLLSSAAAAFQNELDQLERD